MSLSPFLNVLSHFSAIAFQKADQSGGGRCTFTAAAKGAGLILEFAYVVYDLNKQTSEALGAGTYFLIVIACLSDVVLVLAGCAVSALECRMEPEVGSA